MTMELFDSLEKTIESPKKEEEMKLNVAKRDCVSNIVSSETMKNTQTKIELVRLKVCE